MWRRIGAMGQVSCKPVTLATPDVRLTSSRDGDQIQACHSGEVTSGEVGGSSSRHHRTIGYPARGARHAWQLRVIPVDTTACDEAFAGHDRCGRRSV